MKLIGYAAAVLLVLSTGCSHSQNDRVEETQLKMRRDADKLFSEQCRLLKAYTDSARNATDSASLSRASEGCEEALWEANKRYPQLTDASMTPGQNDTLAQLTDKFIKALNHSFNKINEPDTVSAHPGLKE